MDDFYAKLAVITGGGSGIGQQLACELVSLGCDVAICDINKAGLIETERLCKARALGRRKITSYVCDVTSESDIINFRDSLPKNHKTNHINLLFNSAGIAGGGSIIADSRTDWEKTFNVNWLGVYYAIRVFLPLLIRSPKGHIVNVSSVSGFWASRGPRIPLTAYSAAKFAVKGLSEALITDLKVHAPHVRVSVVMPGHVGTPFLINSNRILGNSDVKEMGSTELAVIRKKMSMQDVSIEKMSDSELRNFIHNIRVGYRDEAPLTANQAAKLVLDGVCLNKWRILLGDDAVCIDGLVRKFPELAYDEEFYETVVRESTSL